jgi:hypothetical protein
MIRRAPPICAGGSDDIADMWKALHPGQPIENVQLCLPNEDKAIDIALRFHGKDQVSPRLTLSEGYRNSLGLCILPALAKREAGKDRPLILDDVVVAAPFFKLPSSLPQAVILCGSSFSHSAGISAAGTGGLNR